MWIWLRGFDHTFLPWVFTLSLWPGPFSPTPLFTVSASLPLPDPTVVAPAPSPHAPPRAALPGAPAFLRSPHPTVRTPFAVVGSPKPFPQDPRRPCSSSSLIGSHHRRCSVLSRRCRGSFGGASAVDLLTLGSHAAACFPILFFPFAQGTTRVP